MFNDSARLMLNFVPKRIDLVKANVKKLMTNV